MKEKGPKGDWKPTRRDVLTHGAAALTGVALLQSVSEIRERVQSYDGELQDGDLEEWNTVLEQWSSELEAKAQELSEREETLKAEWNSCFEDKHQQRKSRRSLA